MHEPDVGFSFLKMEYLVWAHTASIQSFLIAKPCGSLVNPDRVLSGFRGMNTAELRRKLEAGSKDFSLSRKLSPAKRGEAMDGLIFGKYRHGGLTRTETRINKTHILQKMWVLVSQRGSLRASPLLPRRTGY